jgi:hypothetical protein
MTVLAAAETGTYRDLLVALRYTIARTIEDGCAPRDLVGLSKRLCDLHAEIRDLDAEPRLRAVGGRDEPFDPSVI